MSETPDVNRSAILLEAGATADSEFLHFYDNGAEGIRIVSQAPVDETSSAPHTELNVLSGTDAVPQMTTVMSFVKKATADTKKPEEKLTPSEETRLNKILALLAKGKMPPESFSFLAKISGKMGGMALPPNVQIAMTNLSKTTQAQMGSPAPKMNPLPKSKQMKTEDRYIKDGEKLDNTLKHIVGSDALLADKANTLEGKKPSHRQHGLLKFYLPENMCDDPAPSPNSSNSTSAKDDAAEGSLAMKNDRKAAQKWYGHAYALNADLAPHPN